MSLPRALLVLCLLAAAIPHVAEIALGVFRDWNATDAGVNVLHTVPHV